MSLSVSGIWCQKRIILQNPSFEGPAGQSRPPMGWTNCGAPGESPVDIQPGSFDVNFPPYNGNTYLGMVTRDIGTYEGISQRLKTYGARRSL